MSVAEALTFAELSSVVPRSGAEYSFLMEAFGSLHKFWGPLPCFVCALIYVFVLSPSASAVIVMTFSEYVCQPFEYHMGGLTRESQNTVKKIIAILGLGEYSKITNIVPSYVAQGLIQGVINFQNVARFMVWKTVIYFTSVYFK
jgi:amino acid transporter